MSEEWAAAWRLFLGGVCFGLGGIFIYLGVRMLALVVTGR